MSEQSISDKSQIIRNETQQHANTRGRVADVIDDINSTKANKTDVTGVAGDISAHLGDFNNPHQVTKSQVGLGNVDNTADIDKPISNAVQAELDDIRTDIQGQTDWNEAQDGRLDQLEQHNIDQDTALGNKANTDASNISEVNSELWRKKLNVPQIPDSVISIGAVTADSSTVYLALPLTGKNTVLIDGQTYERTDPQSFPFTPVTTGEKILIIHALPDAQVFHLAQGAESTEAVEPAYSGLFVARILVNSSVQIVEEEENDYKMYADDAWRNFSINEAGVYEINMANSLAGSFSINVAAGVSTPTIGLIKQKAGKSFRDGAEFWIHNISNKDIILYPSDFTDFDIWKHITFTETTILKAESWAKLKIKYGELAVIEMGGGGDLTLEQARLNGNVLEGDIEFKRDNNDYSIFKNNLVNEGVFFGIMFRDNHIVIGNSLTDQIIEGSYLVFNNTDISIRNFNETTDNINSLIPRGYVDGLVNSLDGKITTETNARIAADKIETVVIALSPFNEDLLDNTSRLGMGVLTFPLKVLSFQTSAYPVPTGSGITTDLRKNGTSVATSVISAGATNSTGNPPPTFSDDTFAIGDRLNFFTPTGGVGSTVKGQNLVATLIIQRL